MGTYLEQKFRAYLLDAGYRFVDGNSASGIDFPGLEVDIKVTSIVQPQSSCPYKSAQQKIFGLGYSLLVFVYDKLENADQTSTLDIKHTLFIDAAHTADFQMTRGLRAILDNQGNIEDLMAFISDRNLPVDEIELERIAQELLLQRPKEGYLTISNALQWRLQYGRAIELARQSRSNPDIVGIESIR